MTKIEDITKCANCGNIIDTSKEKFPQKSPCIKCGSTTRNYDVTIIENLQAVDVLGVKGKRPGKKKPFVEDISMPDYSHSKKKLVHKERLIDRDNDKYREKITDYQTRETIHYCEEPLSKHFEHGSARRISCPEKISRIDNCNHQGYNLIMIKSFKHKGLETFFYTGKKKGIKPEQSSRLERILDSLNAADDIKDMNYPGSNLHQLTGNKKGQYAVNVSGNWRVFFEFIDGDAYIVDYDDYH